ncbi:putative ATP-dependent RNA helicase TDRD12 [Anopheles moucheti]|uniref:putative ATP-dependent RNA helicase TDRD12 n=1 Tax=Anopheles moucheti TaxID=186751 RepID=UPI0022F0DC02|nr:putative ATP-dependent RNA helicase TDRD12 [Anopheles moucheti]
MENQIYITHFSNPHKFWYKPFYPGSKTRQFKQMQDAIDEYCEQHYMAQDIVDYEPIYGEVVAYFEPSLARWTRCSVVGIKEEDKRMRSYRLWLIDEGYPKVVDMEHLKPLPEEFQDMSTSTVKQAALKNILPAHCVYDPQREEFRKAICLSWNENANTMIQSLIKETQKICFTNVSPYPMGNRLIDFGDLLIYTNSKTFNAADVLSQWTLGLIVDFETYMNLIFERKAMLCSQTSSLCSEPLNDSGSLEITVKTPKQYFCTNEVNERLFDESASMVGVMMKQPAVVDAMRDKSEANSNLFTTTSQSAGKTDAEVSETDTKMSRLRQKMQLQMAQKMKYTPVKGSEEQTPVKPVVQSTISSTMLCKTTTKHLQEDNHILDPLSRIRMSPQSLTIDVAQSTQAEYDLMHTESKKPALPQSYTASEHDTPPLVKINNNQTSAGSGTAPKFMRKITKVKANLNQQKHIAPVAAQSPPRKMVFAPAGVQISSLLTPEKMPTSESNGALKRFEKVIQDEKCLFSRRSHYRVLVHGSKLPNPIDRIEAANFSPRVHQNLEQLGITKIHRLQAYSWPHILRDNSFICVNGATTGKTFAYLPAVCSVVQRQIEESLVPSGAGPVALIVCYSSREAQRIAFFCRKMLNSAAHPELTVLECYGIRNVTKNCNLLFNGCAILITTASGYRRLYERVPEAFNRKRIQTVVIDNIEEIWPHFAPELRLLCKNCEKEGLQMIVTAGYWMPVLGIFLQRYHNMIICIGAFIEAAVYAKAEFSFRLFASDEHKEIELIRQLRQHDYRNERTIVFGKDSNDLLPIVNVLKQNSINHIVCNERTVLQQHAGFSNWDEQLQGDMVVFVCSDEVLGDLKITKAQHIIHYSLPSTWSTFTRRYACSFEYYESPYLSCESKEAKGKPSSLVLLNENNNQELPRLVDFLELHLSKVSEKLLNYAKRIRSIHESTRISDGRAVSMLCTHVLGLAVCRSIRNCVFRHALTPDDVATETVPINGKIRLKICHVFSPAHYAVHLDAHQPTNTSDWTVLNDSRRYMIQDIAVQAHYANEERHRMHGELRRKELCAVYHEQNYSRCRIINYDETNMDNCEVQLQLIDTGRIIHVKSSALLFLPEQFRELPGHALNVRIASLVPHDYEQDWDKTSTLAVRKWIEEHVHRSNCYIEGHVLLALKDTIWVDDLYLVEQLKGVKATVTTKRIGATVISKQFGIGNKKSFEQIRQIVHDCEKLAMQLLRHEVQEKENQNNEECRNELDEPDNIEEPVMENQKRTPFFYNQNRDQTMELTQTNLKLEHIPTNSVHSVFGELEDSAERAKALVGYEQDVKTDQPSLVPAELDGTCSSSSFEEPSLSCSVEHYQFDTLLVNKAYNVIIGHYLAPDNFYVYRCDSRISEIDTAIREFVKDGSKLIPLKNPTINQHCLVLYENFYHRARIMKLSEVNAGIEAEVFLLDFGGTFKCSNIFKISDKLLRSVSFLAIKGSLAHILPPDGAIEWSEKIADAIYDKWLEKYNQGMMFATVTRVLPWGSAERIEGCHRYEMVLGDGNSSDEFSIIKDIVFDKLAILLQEDIEDDRSTVVDTDDEFTHVNFTQQELMNMMKEITEPRNEINKKKPNEEPQRISEISEPSPAVSRLPNTKLLPKSDKEKESNRRLQSDRKLQLTKSLVSNERFAKIVWHQDNYDIVLRVHAPDMERYDVKNNYNWFMLEFFKADDEQRYIAPLNLHSRIDPRHTEHEIRGLSIVVRLRKLVPYTRWPKLHKHGRKLAWIKAATTISNDSDSSSDESIKKNRWKGLVQAHLDSSADSLQSGNEQDIDSDVEDEEGVFLSMK